MLKRFPLNLGHAPLLSLLFATTTALLPVHGVQAESQGPATSSSHAREGRLRGLSAEELQALRPYLEQGPAGLVEFADKKKDELPAVNVVTRVRAPLAKLLAAVREPTAYPRFMGTMDEVEIVGRNGDSIIYDWRFALALLKFGGRNIMRVYEGNATRGHRVTIESQSGDLGTGRMSLRLHPDGPDASLLIASVRLDLRTANYVARQAARAGRSVNRSANMALAYAMALGLAQEAERLTHGKPHNQAPAHARTIARPPLGKQAIIQRLLQRGDLVLLDLAGNELRQAMALGQVFQPQPLVFQAMSDARGLGSSLIPGSAAEIIEESAERTIFDWAIHIPLFGISGRMELRPSHGSHVDVKALQGALEGGHWSFEANSLQPQITLVESRGAFDIRKTNMLLRALVEADPNLAHGVTAAGEVMLLRALRTRTAKLAPPPTHKKPVKPLQPQGQKRSPGNGPTPAAATDEGDVLSSQ